MNQTDATTKTILLYLAVNGHPCWRQNTVGIRGRYLSRASRGIGDIVAVVRPEGRHLEVEIKTGADRPRKDQLDHAERVKRAGGWHFFVKDFDDFQSQFKGKSQ